MPEQATVNSMKYLELQGASAGTNEANIDAVIQNANPQCGKCGLNHGKNVLRMVQDAGNVSNTIIGSKCAELSSHRTDKPGHLPSRNSMVENTMTKENRARYIWLKKKALTLGSCYLRASKLITLMLMGREMKLLHISK